MLAPQTSSRKWEGKKKGEQKKESVLLLKHSRGFFSLRHVWVTYVSPCGWLSRRTSPTENKKKRGMKQIKQERVRVSERDGAAREKWGGGVQKRALARKIETAIAGEGSHTHTKTKSGT